MYATMTAAICFIALNLNCTGCSYCTAEDKRLDRTFVYGSLNAIEFEKQELLILGPEVYSIYVDILNDPESDSTPIQRIFGVLRNSRGDRSRFLPHAITRLGDSNSEVRTRAADLLSYLGSSKDTAGLHVLLSDSEMLVSVAAAKSLSAIGTENDLHAMNVWLMIYKPKNLTPEQQNSHNAVRKKVTEYRDELKARLDKAKKPVAPK